MIAALSCLGAAVLRSPKDAANQPKKVFRPKATNDLSALMPPAQPAIVLKPPFLGPYHITLAWEATPGYSYQLSIGSNAPPGQRAIPTTNLWATVSNLWHPAVYQFAVSIVDKDGWMSQMSPVCYWPQPHSNFLSLGVSQKTNDPWTTNSTVLMDQSNRFYRLQTNAGTYALQSSPNFKQWTTDTNWPAANPLPTFYLRARRWDNFTGMEHRD